jgi:hypothetical protein
LAINASAKSNHPMLLSGYLILVIIISLMMHQQSFIPSTHQSLGPSVPQSIVYEENILFI